MIGFSSYNIGTIIGLSDLSYCIFGLVFIPNEAEMDYFKARYYCNQLDARLINTADLQNASINNASSLLDGLNRLSSNIWLEEKQGDWKWINGLS